jgi:uncharacterized protein
MIKQKRGFASMDPEKQRKIAQRGGRAAQATGKGHKLSGEAARRAGRKGGIAVSKNREHMAEIGRKGGKAKSKRNEAAE